MRQTILAAALAIADERGLEAVSMRAVGLKVGLSAMALYPHVSSKDALLDGMVELLLTELVPLADAHHPAEDGEAAGGASGGAVGDGGEEWWLRLVALAQAARKLAGKHPSAFTLLLSRPSVTPEALRATDALYQTILDAGVPDDQVARVERLLSTFVMGFAASEVNGRFGRGTLTPTSRRTQLAPAQLPAHYRLAPHLDDEIDFNAEFEADLADLRVLLESMRRK
ncbi:TetR/AcrR family transcriptional regulator C-terminal domain-containing protein [Kribbella hippodromi]|uniref:TetR/AcrR family transcriptional regulator C-terminal domain-containing protein n=1 Tax=Kribbella hippodromi TaxID=434347 RepID=A0ABP4MZM8_9ACTN